MTDLRKTPLYEFHKAQGARIVDFAGWEMPVQYTGMLEEALAVRNTVGLFDVSHMGEARVRGIEAEACLNFILTNDTSKLEIGKALYSAMCYDDGGCIDDLIVYKLGIDDYLLCLNAGNVEKDIDWLKKHSEAFDCSVEDVSSEYGQLALQGPKAREVMESVLGDSVELNPFTFKLIKVEGIEVLLSATGYTGETGYELYCPWAKTEKIAELLMESGQRQKITLAGLGSRDILRLEAGYSLYGHEISEAISPLEAGLGFVVKFKKDSDFIGKQALIEQKEAGLGRKLIFFKLEERRMARQGAKVYLGENEVGEVVSGAMSVMLNQPIGSALVKASAIDDGLDVDIRGNRIPLNLVKPPFYKKES